MIVLFKEETGRGDQIRTYDGTTGWVRTPLNVLGEFQLVGGDLDGARFDAQLSFPGQIKQILTNLRTGEPTAITDIPMSHSQAAVQAAIRKDGTAGKSVNVDVVQGNGPRGLLMARWTSTRRVPACFRVSCVTAKRRSAAYPHK